MQEAIPYKTWTSFPINHKTKTNSTHDHSTISTIKGARRLNDEDMRKLVTENAVIVFGSRGCCMTHVVNRLLQGQGVNPAVYEVDEKDEKNLIDQLQMIDAGKHEGLQFPVVYIGGQLFGGLDRIMATHITGELIPVLKQARALWL